MTRVLVDTSIWIEFFREKPSLSEANLSFINLLAEEDRLLTTYPVQTELLSGRGTPSKQKEIHEAFEALPHIDLDWNQSSTWDHIVELAQLAHRKSIGVPGIVDRMILASAQEAEASLWTLDRSLKRLAIESHVPLF